MEEGIMLEIVNLNKYYYDYHTFHALKDINLSFQPGEFVAILGESGSGKSTLLNVISGLDRYDSGDILLNGQSTKHFSKRDWAIYRNNYVGFIFQEYNLIDHLTLVENVELPLLLQGVSPHEARKRAIEKCKLLGLENHLNKIPAKLSGGQQQRTAIARALVTDPVVLLADEPTGALDEENGEIILSILKKLSKDYIVILVTHDEENAKKYADRIVLLEDGRVIDDQRIHPIQPTSKALDFTLKKPRMRFKIRRKFAWNNMKKRKFRTFLTAFTMGIGLIAIFLIVFLVNGIQTEVKDFLKKFLPENQYLVSSEKRLVKLDEDDLAFVQSLPDIEEAYFKYRLVMPYESNGTYSFEGIPKNERHFYGKNQLIGNYPKNGNEVIVTTGVIEANSWLNYDLKNESDLKVALRDLADIEIIITALIKEQEEPLDVRFKIVGIINTQMQTVFVYNDKLIELYELLPEKEEDQWFDNPFIVDYEYIHVFIKDDRERTIERLEQTLFENGYVLNNPTQEIIRSTDDFFRSVLYVLVGTASISLIVSGILIGLIIYISVLERVKEIGILTALGAKAQNIRSLFNFESGMIGFFSAFLSLAISLLITFFINYSFRSMMRTLFGGLGLPLFKEFNIMRVDWIVVIAVFAISIIYAIICGLIPAFKASRLHAIEALRKE